MSVKTVRVTKHPLPQPVIRLVQGDSNTQVLRFLVKKEFGGKDLSGLIWSVWVQGYDGEAEVSYIGIGNVDGDELVLDWEVIPAVTKAAGYTVLKLLGSNDGEDDRQYAWVSGNMIINVTPTQMICPCYEDEDVDTLRQLIVDFGRTEGTLRDYTDQKAGEVSGTLGGRIGDVESDLTDKINDLIEDMNDKIGQINGLINSLNGSIDGLKDELESNFGDQHNALVDQFRQFASANNVSVDLLNARIANIAGASPWVEGQVYHEGEWVWYDNTVWIAIRQNADVPADGYYWRKVTLGRVAAEIPSVQCGISDWVTAGANSYAEVTISFPTAFLKTPRVVGCFYYSNDNPSYGDMTLAVKENQVSTTGAIFGVYNSGSTSRRQRIMWIAVSNETVLFG